MEFNLEAFQKHRNAFRGAGVRTFGGWADLILLDAHFAKRRVCLDFTKALYIDIAAEAAEMGLTGAGAFLQGLLDAA